MASGASTDSVVKAGYWIFRKEPIPMVSEIPSELFTHLYAGFAEVDNDGKVTFPKQYLELFKEFTRNVRAGNPTVKTLLSIGGTEGSPISPVVKDAKKRQTFITTSICLARDNLFDGLDLCWLYPSGPADKPEDLGSLLKEWRTAAKDDAKKRNLNESLLLTAAVFHHPVNKTFNYPIEAINESLDWINVLAIDFYAPSTSSVPHKTGPVHAWDTQSTDQKDRCGRVGIEEWIKNEVVTNKLVLALPFYGYEWTLKDPKSSSGFFALADPAKKDPMAYRDIQKEVELRKGIYETVYYSNYIALYSHEINGAKWIGYDNALCISGKVSEARNRNLRGYFAWHLDADDAKWTLSKAASNAWDNIAINNPGSTTTITTNTTHTGSTTTTTITTTTTAVSPEGKISKTVTTDITTTDDAAAASGEGDTTKSDQNTSTRTSTTTTTTTTSATTTTTTATATATATSNSSVNICNIL